jgi:hypothetical protein
LRAAGNSSAERRLFFVRQPIAARSAELWVAELKRVSDTLYAAVVALLLVRQDFAAAITALSSLSVSPARKPRIRRND